MVSSKLPTSRRSIIATMTQLAREHHAIDLALSVSDLPSPEALVELMHKYVSEGYNHYAPMEGIEPLRQVIVDRIKQLHQKEYNQNTEITITAGSTQAMATTISAFIKEGEEVLLFEPVSESYISAIELNGGRPVYVNLKKPDFHIDWDEVKKLMNAKTRMIIINNPQNPTGRVMNEEDINQLKRLTNGTRILILSNEIFEHIVFDEEKHRSMSSVPELAERSLVVSSFGPVYKISGWGIAYVVGPEKLMNEFRKIQLFQGYSVNTPGQYALAEFLQEDNKYEDIADFYQGRRNYFNRLMNESNFDVIPAAGTYYQVLDYSKISDETDVEFAMRLVKDYGVSVLPLSAFQHEKTKSRMLRICFARNNEVLEEAAKRLCSVPVLHPAE